MPDCPRCGERVARRYNHNLGGLTGGWLCKLRVPRPMVHLNKCTDPVTHRWHMWRDDDGSEWLCNGHLDKRATRDLPRLPGMPEEQAEPELPPVNDAFKVGFTCKIAQDGTINVLDAILRFPEDWERMVEKEREHGFEETVSQYIWEVIDDSADWSPMNHNTLIWDTLPFDADIDFPTGGTLKAKWDPMLESLRVELVKREMWSEP